MILLLSMMDNANHGGQCRNSFCPITIKSDLIHMAHYIYNGTWTAQIIVVINYNRHISNLSTWDLTVPVSTLSINDFATGETDLATSNTICNWYLYKHRLLHLLEIPGELYSTTAPTAGNFARKRLSNGSKGFCLWNWSWG